METTQIAADSFARRCSKSVFDTPRTLIQVKEADGYRTETEAIAHMVDFCKQIEIELCVALDAADRSDLIAAERLREICRVSDLVLSIADSPLSLIEHLKPWAHRHCTLNVRVQSRPTGCTR